MSEQHTLFDSAQQPEVEYRDVLGFPGYRVGDDGSLWSKLRRNGRGMGSKWRRLTPGNCRGYHLYTLLRDRKQVTRLVHRLVLEAFIGPRPVGMECCHNDGNRGNNALSNLRWDTRQANHDDAIRHGTHPRGEKNGMAKTTEEQAKRVIELLDNGWFINDIASHLGVGRCVVADIRTGKRWKHLPRCRVYETFYYGDKHHSRRKKQ